MEKLRKNSSLRCILAPKYDEDANPMGNKIPYVKFIQEALARSLLALTAEGNLLLEDENFENRTWADASPINSFLSQIHQARSFVFSDSMFCVGTSDHFQTAKYVGQVDKLVRMASQRHRKSINHRSLDCTFNVNAGSITQAATAKDSASMLRRLPTTLVRSARQRRTPTASS